MTAYFCEGSKAMCQLEEMVDKVGMANVLYALEHICGMKAEHILANWQDRSTAQWWQRRAAACNKLAGQAYMHDAGEDREAHCKSAEG